MNRIQLISQDISARRLKLQKGRKPAANIDPHEVRPVGRVPELDRIKAKLNSQSIGAGRSETPPA